MKTDEPFPDLEPFGGPLYRLGCRLRLVNPEVNNTLLLGIVLGLVGWLPLAVILTALGKGELLLGLDVLGVHVRLLLAIPLFFLCEVRVFPQMVTFVREIVRAGLVRPADLEIVKSRVLFVNQRTHSWLVELVLLTMGLVVPVLGLFIELPGRSANASILQDQRGGHVGPALVWYLAYGLPLMRYLMLRWVWRLALWIHLLWRLSRLRLNLTPTHPDGSGGLGFLEIVQENFTPLILAMSAILSASFAEDISSGRMPFESLYGMTPTLLLFIAALFVGPMLLFFGHLRRSRIEGWSKYMGMASRYVEAFDRRWIQDEKATGETQLGSADLQSLADLNTSVNTVRDMQVMPGSRRLLLSLSVAAVLPLLPLVLLKYPINEVLAVLIRTVAGFD